VYNIFKHFFKKKIVAKPLDTPTQKSQSSAIIGTISSNPGYYNVNINTHIPQAGLYPGKLTLNPSLSRRRQILALHDSQGQEIVKLNDDGTVTWANDINVDEAAEAFSKVMLVGGEIQAGITQAVKYKMRDSVFNDLIEIAKEKGPLTAEDLTYLLGASKIVEKLKGGKE
jgi:hypothetical protein